MTKLNIDEEMVAKCAARGRDGSSILLDKVCAALLDRDEDVDTLLNIIRHTVEKKRTLRVRQSPPPDEDSLYYAAETARLCEVYDPTVGSAGDGGWIAYYGDHTPTKHATHGEAVRAAVKMGDQ